MYPILTVIIDMIYENAPITNAFVSVPADMSQFNGAAYIAGIIAGIMDSAKFVSINKLVLLGHDILCYD